MKHLSLRAAIMLPVLLFLASFAHCQSVELDCPGGYQRAIFPGSVTVNPANQAIRYNFCIVAANGHIFYQGDGISGGTQGPLNFQVTSYQPNAGTAQGIVDGSSVNGSQTITCPNLDCNFTTANIGNVIFGIGSGVATCPPQTTISSINNANSVQVVLPATATATGTCQLRWGPDATPGFAAAWAALIANPDCGVLVLPAGAMILRQPQWQSVPANCRLLGAAAGEVFGASVVGQAVGSGRQSVIFPTPDFNYAGITGGTGAMFGGAPIYMAGFSVDGAGQNLSGTPSANSHGVFLVSNGAFVQNVTAANFGQGAAAFYGIAFGSFGGINSNITIDGVGQNACTTGGAIQTTLLNVYCSNGAVSGGGNGLTMSSGVTILSIASFYLASNTNAAGVSFSSATNATLNSYGDVIQCQNNPSVGISFNNSTGSRANLYGDTFQCAGNALAQSLTFNTNDGTVTLLNTILTSGASRAAITGVAGDGTVIDLSGNTCNGGPCPGTGTSLFTGAYLTSTNEIGRLSQTVTTATVGPTTVYAAPAGGAGLFRVCVNEHVTALGTAGTITPTITWNNGAAQSITLTALSLTTANNEYPNGAGGSTTTLGCFMVSANASTNIQVTWTVAGATGTPSTVAIATVEKL